MEDAVVVDNLVKEYRIYNGSFARFKEALSFGRRRYHSVHRALDGVSVNVPKGRALGLIGENGAGKSTLLKILAGTSLPTRGSYTVDGNVASLLELGTGFHSEFTGRDNIYLAAQVQGFSLKEVESRIDEIVAFAELGSFIDQPVRTYSSGMVMRLGFSVATAIDPEVLIIDEILAVGDLYFQKKCIDRIFDFRKRGKSILFCSHSMYDVRQVCDEVAWIHEGRVRMRGEPQDVTVAYANFERALQTDPEVYTHGKTQDTSEDRPVIAEIRMLQEVDGACLPITQPLHPGEPLVAEMDCVLRGDDRHVHMAWAIFRNDNIIVSSFFTALADVPALYHKGRYRCRMRIPALPLLEGEYHVVGYLLDETFVHTYDHRQVDRPLLVTYDKNVPGVAEIPHEFTVERLG